VALQNYIHGPVYKEVSPRSASFNDDNAKTGVGGLPSCRTSKARSPVTPLKGARSFCCSSPGRRPRTFVPAASGFKKKKKTRHPPSTAAAVSVFTHQPARSSSSFGAPTTIVPINLCPIDTNGVWSEPRTPAVSPRTNYPLRPLTPRPYDPPSPLFRPSRQTRTTKSRAPVLSLQRQLTFATWGAPPPGATMKRHPCSRPNKQTFST